jgi:DNA repair photolyase
MERGRMERGRVGIGRVGIGTVTDPYQKGEGRYEVTRRCLQVLSSLASPPPITIQTKCSLVKRDLDLLVGLDVDVGFTITSLDSTPYEPYASSSRERIDCARALVEEGIETWAFIGPILPGLTDLDVRGFIDELSFFPKIFVDRFRPRPGMVDRIKRSLVQDELVDRLEAALSDGSYFIKVAKEIEDACKARGMECERVF